MTSISTEENVFHDAEHASNDNSDLHPLDLLMEELKHDDTANRVEAMRKLDTIALALGPQRTRDELIPFLTEVAQDDEDEVFAVLAEELGDFVPYLGGPEYANYLLAALEILASTEETLVRDTAVESLNKVAAQLSQEHLLHDFISVIEHLATADWFSSKVSSCGIFKSVIMRVEDDTLRKNILALYFQLVQDETPMVRRAAAKNLPDMIDLLTTKIDLSTDEDWDYISSMFQKITTDNQDSVRLLGVDILISILKFFNIKKDDSHLDDLLNSCIKLTADDAWRVRYAIASKFDVLAVQFVDEDDKYTDELLKPFILLCEDNESDVRKAIAKKVATFSGLLHDKAIINLQIIPTVQSLSMDEDENVRASLALCITDLVKLLNKDEVTEHLLPLFLNMLKDEFPDVRLNIIGNLKVVNEIIGIKTLSESLLPAVSELAKDMNWRIRIAIIEYIPVLARQLGSELFDQQFSDLCISWLWDIVYSVREAAIENIKKLTEIFGSEWCKVEITDKLINFDQELFQNFIYRITILTTLIKIGTVIDMDPLKKEILPFIISLAQDEVPNIRFNVAKGLAEIATSLIKRDSKNKKLIKEELLPVLENLVQDEDVDVNYFSEQSYNSCKEMLETA
ncbi:hypothetical protein TPHA_0L00520 [Tetrapisispora phaffii CBS 4417]|uniref:Phosphatase PP2A regulatory subunit A/Splicing factor 3B subunit 1-like HEAT repeat domain-containing protein n=1 Tax=Tetrapisispora phaffii (strain ATCC 24235 / CBS 4417 / NBRC 1672 / NRRL Y-8282 / UCD 70-5) TaxID=1071381 RepID=G8BZT0_TETPH|nr:hypothetical protein TPHA_0L00520 [Tetrapisispora phaffii CBS 4417]CCE65408.1 hypothetical protein TPHA_0L00520 [Tetrapisispora phaffii CBS 4417]